MKSNASRSPLFNDLHCVREKFMGQKYEFKEVFKKALKNENRQFAVQLTEFPDLATELQFDQVRTQAKFKFEWLQKMTGIVE